MSDSDVLLTLRCGRAGLRQSLQTSGCPAEQESRRYVHACIARVFAYGGSSALGDSYNEVFMRFWSAFIEAEEVLLARRRAALRVWAWAMRGLILRSDSRAYDGVAKLVTLFQHPQLAKEAARTMSILGRDDDGILIKPNFANIKVGSGRHRQSRLMLCY